MKKYILAFLLFALPAFAGGTQNFSASLASQVTGVLPVANGGTCGTGAVREATTNATLALTDCGNIIKLNKDDAITCTVPLNATVAFAIGSQINVIPAQAAVGDPNKFYTCIRSPEAIIAPEGIEVVDPSGGIAVCGGWA